MKHPAWHPLPTPTSPEPIQPRLRFAWILVLWTVSLAHAGHAAVRFWDGGGATAFWGNAANWSNNVAPTLGDSLVFPNQTNRLDNSNRLQGGLTNLHSITWLGKGYDSTSPLLHLSGGLSNLPPVNGANTLRADLSLTTNQTWVSSGKSLLSLSGDITLEAGTRVWTIDLNSGGQFEFSGNVFAGPVSRIVKTGPGILHLQGASNNVGNFVLAEGTLTLSDSLTASTLTISNGASLAAAGILSAFSTAGDLRPGALGIQPGKLKLNSTNPSRFLTGSRLFIDLAGLLPGSQFDQLECRTNPDLSGAQLFLTPAPTFSFRAGQSFVIITNTGNGLQNSTFLNLPENSRITNNGIVFSITYKGGSGNDVALKVISAPFIPSDITHTWQGTPTSGPGWNLASNWNTATVPDENDSLLFPSTATGQSLSNNLPAETLLDRITFTGSLARWKIQGNPLQLARGFQLNSTDPASDVVIKTDSLTIPFTQVWSTSNMTMSVDSPMLFQSNMLSLVSAASGQFLFSKPLHGPGQLRLEDGHVSFLKGANFSNVTMQVEAGSHVFRNIRTLASEWSFLGGTAEFLDVLAPTLSLQNTLLSLHSDQPSRFSGTLNLHPSTTVQFIFSDNNQPPASCDSLINLSNAQLKVVVTSLDAVPNEMVLVQNPNNIKVQGTFKDLPEGAFVFVQTGNPDLQFPGIITYKGGQGNDIVLSITPPPWSQKLIVWNGSAPAGLWSTTQNWNGNTIPRLADRVRFPANASRFRTTNDFHGLTLESVEWQGAGYFFEGSLQLIQGFSMTVPGTNVWHPGTLYSTHAPHTWNIADARAHFHILGGQSNAGTPPPPMLAADVELVPTDLFARATLTKTGPGLLLLQNINVISPAPADVEIRGGVLDLDGVSLARAGTLRHFQGGLFSRGVVAQNLVSVGGILRLVQSTNSPTSTPPLRVAQASDISNDTVLQILPPPFPTPSFITDQLSVNNPRLELLLPPPGQPITSEFVLASYTTGKRSGLINNLNEGDLFNFEGHLFSIHYDVSIPGTPAQRRSIVLRKETTVAPEVQTLTLNGNLQPVLEGTAAIRSIILIESSTDLIHWQIIGQVQSGQDQGIFSFTDARPLEAFRFYRATLP